MCYSCICIECAKWRNDTFTRWNIHDYGDGTWSVASINSINSTRKMINILAKHNSIFDSFHIFPFLCGSIIARDVLCGVCECVLAVFFPLHNALRVRCNGYAAINVDSTRNTMGPGKECPKTRFSARFWCIRTQHAFDVIKFIHFRNN